MTQPATLECRAISLSRNNQPLLNGFSACWSAPKKVAIAGHNGCGKSTLLALLAGQLPASSGAILVSQQPARSANSQRQIGWLSQEVKPLADFNLSEMLVWLQQLELIPDDVELVKTSLDLLELKPLLNTPVRHLSKGNQQKVFACLTLCQRAPILLLDEVTNALDYGARQKLLTLIEQRCANKLLLFVSHHTEEILRLADELLLFVGAGELLHLTSFSRGHQWLYWAAAEEVSELESLLTEHLAQGANHWWLLPADAARQVKDYLARQSDSLKADAAQFSAAPQWLSFEAGLRQIMGRQAGDSEVLPVEKTAASTRSQNA